MGTTAKTIGTDAYELVTDNEVFLVQASANGHLRFAFSDTLPAATDPGLVLLRNEGLTRNGLTGNLYAIAINAPAQVIIAEG